MKLEGMQSVKATQSSAVVEKIAAETHVLKAKSTEGISEKSTNEDVVKSVGDYQEVINDEMLDKAIEVANKSLIQHNSFIERSIHEVTKTVMYVMKDATTNEVIKEFPPKKIQDMIAKMWELAGLFVDEKA